MVFGQKRESNEENCWCELSDARLFRLTVEENFEPRLEKNHHQKDKDGMNQIIIMMVHTKYNINNEIFNEIVDIQ